MATHKTMQLTIDEATVLMVAEILRKERGAAQWDVEDAQVAIVDAVKRMRAFGSEASDG